MSVFKAPQASAPLYSFEPGKNLLYQSAQIAIVMYGADKDRVADLVPPPCQVPGTPKVICFVARFAKSPWARTWRPEPWWRPPCQPSARGSPAGSRSATT